LHNLAGGVRFGVVYTPHMDTGRARATAWPSVAAFAVIAWLAWFSYVRGERVPLLAGVDLGFHELGHLLMAWAPDQLAAVAGSVMQISVPLALAAYFMFARQEAAAGALMLGWAGTSAQNVSVYIADAPLQQLELIGGRHDWAFLLGPEAWNVMGSAGGIATAVWALGLLLLVGGFGVCAAAIVRARLQATHAAAELARLATLPVHEPSTQRPVMRTAEAAEAGSDPVGADAVRSG
jgi:hypothetical protein